MVRLVGIPRDLVVPEADKIMLKLFLGRTACTTGQGKIQKHSSEILILVKRYHVIQDNAMSLENKM